MQRTSARIIANLAVILVTLLGTAAFPSGRHKVLVISPTWLGHKDAFTVIAEAGGAPLQEGRSPSFALGYSEAENFSARLYTAGALLVLSFNFLNACA